MCIIYIILVLVPIVVELGAPKPIALSYCFSILYENINLTIPHKNNTQIGFKPDFNEMRLFDLPCFATAVSAHPTLLSPVSWS